MTESDIDTLDWAKSGGLLPAIIQHAETAFVARSHDVPVGVEQIIGGK